MNLQRLQHYMEVYRKWLRRHDATEHLFWWEAQKNWQTHWDIDATDFKQMYNLSLHSTISKRLWKTDNYFPKERMLQFISMQPDFTQHIFKDLFKEDKELLGRADRFVFHCDELLKEYKITHPASVVNNHFHADNYGMISVYLSFQYPDRYTLFNFSEFRLFLEKLGSLDVPKGIDYVRFVKVSRTLYKLLSKDDKLMQLHQQRLQHQRFYQDTSMLLVADFIKKVVAT